MVSVEVVEVVNSLKFMDVFNSFYPKFDGDERTYCVVVSTNELSYIHIPFLLIYFLFFQTSEDAHKYIMALRKCQLNDLQPGQEDPSVTVLGQPYDKNLHMSV